jgi:hypothetical protein
VLVAILGYYTFAGAEKSDGNIRTNAILVLIYTFLGKEGVLVLFLLLSLLPFGAALLRFIRGRY